MKMGLFEGPMVTLGHRQCVRSVWRSNCSCTLIWNVKNRFPQVKSYLRQESATWSPAVRPGQRKEKANWKQSKCILFSVRFHVVAFCLFVCFLYRWRWRRHGSGKPRTGDVSDVGAAPAIPQLLWDLAGVEVTDRCTLSTLTSVCLQLLTLSEVHVRRRSCCMRMSADLWVYTAPTCWQTCWIFVTVEGCHVTSPPCFIKYWSLSLWIIFSCTCTCFILCLLFPVFHFINMSFTDFLSHFLWIAIPFSWVAFLFWCGWDCACFVWSHESLNWVWVSFQSSVLTMVFVFLLNSIGTSAIQIKIWVGSFCDDMYVQWVVGSNCWMKGEFLRMAESDISPHECFSFILMPWVSKRSLP